MAYTPYDNGSFRIRAGWVNQVELTAAYEIERFPKQADQGLVRWMIPLDDSDMYDEWVETVTGLGGGGQALGGASFTWKLGGLLPQMVDYWKNNPALFDGKIVQRFTTQTWNRAGQWEIDWVEGIWKPASEMAEPGFRQGYLRLNIEFLVHQVAPLGPNVTPDITHAATLTNGAPSLIQLGAENVGDGATFDDTVLVAELPAELVFVSAPSTADWTVEYFRGGAWQATVGGTPADVTAIRGTYTGTLNAGATTSKIQLTVTPSTTGSFDLVVETTTTGDTSTGNDQVTESITVV